MASLRLRLVSLLYEGILLLAVLFVSSYLFLSLARDAQSGMPRLIFQIYLLSISGAYFVFCWARTGQTLPMKTWRMRIVPEEGGALGAGRAFKRYLLAIPGMLSGISLLWAPFDRERQFLHDRLAHTRIVRVEIHDSAPGTYGQRPVMVEYPGEYPTCEARRSTLLAGSTLLDRYPLEFRGRD